MIEEFLRREEKYQWGLYRTLIHWTNKPLKEERSRRYDEEKRAYINFVTFLLSELYPNKVTKSPYKPTD